MPDASIRAADPARTELDRFLREVERRALRHAELATHSREDALELVQDAMFAFVRRYRQRPGEEWRVLFWRVLENRLADWYRRRAVRGRWRAWLGRGRDDDDEDPIAAVADPRERGPLAWLGNGEAMAALTAALQALPLRQREAFLLRVWEGLDVAATARAMAISEGSVKTHLFRALQALRARLEEHR